MRKRAILCVDDERIILTGLKKQLKLVLGDDFIVETAESGDEGLEVHAELLEDGYDIPVVISDYIMPGMKGDEFLKNIYDQKAETISILLTGQADTDAVGNAVNEANLYRYIPKPWEPEDVQLTVKEAIQKYDAALQIESQNAELTELNEGLEKKVEARTEELQTVNEELQSLNEELTQTLETVSDQKDELEIKSKKILDSIQYAQRIQKAVLPSKSLLTDSFSKHFIFFQPRDIVSGDFYWCRTIENRIYICVADCTGHGVPGAFMSMLGIAHLNQIDSSYKGNAAQCLDELRDYVKTSLGQTGELGEQQDGMDMAFCIIDTDTKIIQYAGAYNPIFIMREKGQPIPEISNRTQFYEQDDLVLIRVKGNPQPIGVYPKETPFANVEIKIEENDLIYLISDGFVDQVGGDKGKKFMSPKLRKLLFECHNLSMQEKHDLIKKTFNDWKGNYEQVDDVTALGFQL